MGLHPYGLIATFSSMSDQKKCDFLVNITEENNLFLWLFAALKQIFSAS